MPFNLTKPHSANKTAQESAAGAKLEQWIEAMRNTEPILESDIPLFEGGGVNPQGIPPLAVLNPQGMPTLAGWHPLGVKNSLLSRALLAAACLLGAVWMLEVGNPTLNKPIPVEPNALLLAGYPAKSGTSAVKTPAERLAKQQQNEAANRAFRKMNQRINRL